MLSDVEVEQFERDGYVVSRGVLTPDECRELQRVVSAVRNGTASGPAAHLSPQEQFGKGRVPTMIKLNQLTTVSPEFEQLAHRPEIVDAVESLIGPGSRVFRDVVVVKPARTGGVLRHHQDSAYWDVEPRALVSAWIALSDAPAAAGCLSVIPGSQRAPVDHDLVVAGRIGVPRRVTGALRRLVSRAGTGDNVASAGGSTVLWRAKRLVLANATKLAPVLAGLQDYHVRGVDPARCAILEAAAGDVVYFHSLLVHGTGPNTTAGDRVASVISYMPAGSRLPLVDTDQFPIARVADR